MTCQEEPTRVIVTYAPSTGKVRCKRMKLFEWCNARFKEESTSTVIENNDFLRAYNRQNGEIIVYSTTHYDAQKFLRKHVNPQNS